MISRNSSDSEDARHGLRKLYYEQTFCDVTLYFPGFKTIKCHSVVFASISNSFLQIRDASRDVYSEDGIEIIFTDDINDQMKALLDNVYRNLVNDEDPRVWVHNDLLPYIPIASPWSSRDSKIDGGINANTEDWREIKEEPDNSYEEIEYETPEDYADIEQETASKKTSKKATNQSKMGQNKDPLLSDVDPKLEKLNRFQGKELTVQLQSEDEFQAYLTRILPPMMVKGHRSKLLRVLQSQHLHGLMALQEVPEEPGVYEGSMIATAKELQDPDTSMDALVEVMNKILGLPFSEILEASFLYTGKQSSVNRENRGKNRPKNEGTKAQPIKYVSLSRNDCGGENIEMSDEQLRCKLTSLEEDRKKLDEQSKPELKLLEMDKRLRLMNKIKVTRELNVAKETGLVLLYGQAYQDLCMVCLFSNKSFQVVIQNSKPNGPPKLSIIKTLMFDIFSECSGVRFADLKKYSPKYEKMFDKYRDLLFQLKQIQKLLERKTEQCEHCGLVMDVSHTKAKNNSTVHMKNCKLEKAKCDCNVTFKSAPEKRRHMLMFHSGKKLLTCPQCPTFVGKTETALKKHISWYHGDEGVVVTCEICGKNLKSKYHLSVHKFTHREYNCEQCGETITGNANYKRHVVDFHRKGFQCPKCPSVLRTAEQLDKHLKGRHGHDVLV